MVVSISLLLTALLSGDPASVGKAPKPKVYVVYVTVVEVDAEGNETVLFTPKVQTTGNPAGVTVDHTDGRSFEFNCSLSTTTGPQLEQLPTAISAVPAVKTVNPLAAAGSTPVPVISAPAPAGLTKKLDDYFVRTYDVSDLLEDSKTLTPAEFAPLIQTLKAVAEPDSWTGKATIRPFASTKSLVIKQTAAGHKAVTAALDELRPRVVEPETAEKN